MTRYKPEQICEIHVFSGNIVGAAKPTKLVCDRVAKG
jgi:hypothetical protein